MVVLIALGCSNEEVGERLGISARTAKAHCDVLRQKLGVPRRRQIPAAFRTLTGEDPLARELRAGVCRRRGLTATAPGAQAPGAGPFQTFVAPCTIRGGSNCGTARAGVARPTDRKRAWSRRGQQQPSYIIKRPRLTKLLDESEARIILLCAPAGYGKTTLAREWVSGDALWYAVRPTDCDVAAFAAGLAELLVDETRRPTPILSTGSGALHPVACRPNPLPARSRTLRREAMSPSL